MDLQDTNKGEKAHNITTTVYKDLQLNFTQGLKAIWSSGKALHKSLEVTSQKAKAHYDAITILGQAASQSEGTVIGIGHALMQMAEIYKEIQNQVDENIAALKKDLCNPFEFILLDNGEKMEERLRKYTKEHVKLVSPYKKAASNLHKHRKKGKGGIQNPKEMQYYREATECKQRLDRFRLKHLKDALFEEKTCYLYAFERLITIAKNHALQAKKTHESLDLKLADWESLTQSKDLSKDAMKIIESIIDSPQDENADQNGKSDQNTDTLSSNSGSGSLSRSTKDPLPQIPLGADAGDKPKVRALYSHEGNDDNQLSFREDDILLLHGNKRDGWHYGQNIRTKQYGWFPISFTEALRRKNSLDPPTSSLTSSSMSKLSRSVADLTDSGEAPKHRLNFLYRNQGNEERSTMTLPHKKNVSSMPTAEIVSKPSYMPQGYSQFSSLPPPPPPPNLNTRPTSYSPYM
ncbi:hypothetical protein EB796_013476 [Bugula neritina]|uniref:SH3 domain-containing protein n=1 Tax=Bugula neritina TaxID=10212 RepID=A0A7J7JQF6_BUGNE|nr:hypothetical protein EB796_013476 [Bugula neritina]